MNVLIACEFSGAVREAFRRRGLNAWSCDLLPAEDGSKYHYQTNVSYCLQGRGYPRKWDLMIAFPPCTDLAVSGARWFTEKRKPLDPQISISNPDYSQQDLSADFFMDLANANIPRIAIENPIGVMSTRWRKPDQIIQPWMFGHGETKATCLWLKGLPKLTPTNIVAGRQGRVWREPPSPNRWKNRSRTLAGIADAMAEQWGTAL